jgi:hypothetical protein
METPTRYLSHIGRKGGKVSSPAKAAAARANAEKPRKHRKWSPTELGIGILAMHSQPAGSPVPLRIVREIQEGT